MLAAGHADEFTGGWLSIELIGVSAGTCFRLTDVQAGRGVSRYGREKCV
jgi:hypothetical protein